jgi:hypothetical protein
MRCDAFGAAGRGPVAPVAGRGACITLGATLERISRAGSRINTSIPVQNFPRDTAQTNGCRSTAGQTRRGASRTSSSAELKVSIRAARALTVECPATNLAFTITGFAFIGRWGQI